MRRATISPVAASVDSMSLHNNSIVFNLSEKQLKTLEIEK